MSDRLDIAEHVDEQVADDPLWSTLGTVVDEQLCSSMTDDSAFSRAINQHIRRATEELHAAMRLRSAEICHDVIRRDGHDFIERGDHRLAGAEPAQQPTECDQADVEEAVAEADGGSECSLGHDHGGDA